MLTVNKQRSSIHGFARRAIAVHGRESLKSRRKLTLNRAINLGLMNS